jgi:proteasome lid subunit RPN8/RPN11/LysM repeat protein
MEKRVRAVNPEIVISESVESEIEKHCFSETQVEVGGFLVGTIDGNSTNIAAALPSLKAVSTQVNLTITHEAWSDALSEVDAKYPGMNIVGWYHSHPGFGLFLSEYDSFIQENFFVDPNHVALVVDPLEGSLGWFVVREGKTIELSRKDTKLSPIAAKGEERVDVLNRLSGDSEKKSNFSLRIAAVSVILSLLTGMIFWWVGYNSAQNKSNEIYAQQIEDLNNQISAQPTPEPSPTALPQPENEIKTITIVYEVKNGDSLWKISRLFLGDGSRYDELVKANPDLNLSSLEPGMKLKLQIQAEVIGEATQ